MTLRTLIPTVAGLALAAMFSIPAQAEGGFIGAQASYIHARDMDSTNAGFRITFGPHITERLALEMSIFDMGSMSNDDPIPDFTDADTDTAPTFPNAGNGSVDWEAGQNGGASKATYTGFSGLHAQSALLQLSYRFPVSHSIDLFVKGGASIWWANYERVAITAFSDGGISREQLKTKHISAFDAIAGAGLKWNASNHVSIRADFEAVSLDTALLDRKRMRIFSIGAQYNF